MTLFLLFMSFQNFVEQGPPGGSGRANGGVVSTLAGHAYCSRADGTGPAAGFCAPHGLALDAAGNVYVGDYANGAIRRVSPAGVVMTLAGQAGTGGSADGAGAAARFSGPDGVAVLADGSLYVADCRNHTIRRVSPAGVVTTVAGAAGQPGFADGPGPDARFHHPSGLALAADGTLYVADAANSVIRRISPAGEVSTLAGAARWPGSADGQGPAAQFHGPSAVALAPDGSLYVADTYNNTIRRITPAGEVSTVAGAAGVAGAADGPGPLARFNGPEGVAVGLDGTVYVADTQNSTLRQLSLAGLVTTLAGSAAEPTALAADGQGPAARFSLLQGLAVGPDGAAYVADTFGETIRVVR